jgi:ferredoxin-thioredoxin reductase catalytic subunit
MEKHRRTASWKQRRTVRRSLAVFGSIWAWGAGDHSDSPPDCESLGSFQYTSLRMRNRSGFSFATRCIETSPEIRNQGESHCDLLHPTPRWRRNRSRRILEHFFTAEALECLETLVEMWTKADTETFATRCIETRPEIHNQGESHCDLLHPTPRWRSIGERLWPRFNTPRCE